MRCSSRNALIGIRPVRELEGRPLSPGGLNAPPAGATRAAARGARSINRRGPAVPSAGNPPPAAHPGWRCRGAAGPARAGSRGRLFSGCSSSFQAPGNPRRPPARIEVDPGASLRSVPRPARGERRGGAMARARADLSAPAPPSNRAWQAGTYEIPPAGPAPGRSSRSSSRAKVRAGAAHGRRRVDVRGVCREPSISIPYVLHTLHGKERGRDHGGARTSRCARRRPVLPPTPIAFAAHTADVAILELAYDSMQRVLAGAWGAAQRRVCPSTRRTRR